MVANKSLKFWWKQYQKSKKYNKREKTIIKLLSNYVNVSIQETINIFPKQVIIKKKALLKGIYLAKKIIKKYNSPLEIFLYAISENDSDEIIDLQLPDRQKIERAYCEVLEVECLEKKIIKEQKRIIGWIHSHAYFDTFHSSTDYETTREITSVYGIKKKLELNLGYDKFELDIKYSPSVVINAKDSEPDSVLGISYPVYDGKGKLSKYDFILEKASLKLI